MENKMEWFEGLGRVQEDGRLGPIHVSLYVALCLLAKRQGFVDPLPVSAPKLMPLAKIGGKTPYHRTIRELAEFGYIKYLPSCDPGRPSKVWLLTTVGAAGQSGGCQVRSL
jgi:hypothetical protein